MLWDPFLYCINDSIQGKLETGNKVFVLTSKVSINTVPLRSWQEVCPSVSFLYKEGRWY